LGLFVALAWMGRVYPEGLRQRALMLLFMTLSLLSLAAVRLFVHLAIFLSVLSPALLDFVIPLALAPLLASILVGGAYAFALGLWISLAAAVMTNQSLHVLFLGLLVTAVSVLASRRVRKRSKVFQAGLWIGLAKVLYVIFAAVLVQQSWRIVTSQLLAAVLSGVGVALVALLVIPLFEYLFGLTTDIHLLELSDPGHPLLQRLAVEAPGTYHHSLMLASLAQSAADRIGANSLLVRVCAYFHDIGKLTKPEYFTENTQKQRSPHDDLAPSMSTLVIMAHVKEGVSFALRHRLPRPIIEAIQQHHGTGVVEYFYHRARRQRDEASGGPDDASLKEHFRYPGPRPRSREMAILMLADSVEAASRSMEKTSPAKLEALVDEMVSARLRDGQLDQSALTFAELTEIKRSFVFTLTNMLHGRIPYPKDENRNRPSTEKVQDEPVAPEGPRAEDARPGAGDEPGPAVDRRDDPAGG
jgi:putative nucleotidyltransferase with HDIG domain